MTDKPRTELLIDELHEIAKALYTTNAIRGQQLRSCATFLRAEVAALQAQIDAIPTDQLALDSYGKEVATQTTRGLIEYLNNPATKSIEPNEFDKALDRHDAELKAQTAAMLEKAAGHYLKIGYCFSLYRLECSCGWQSNVDSWKHVDHEKFKEGWAQHIRALIPADYAGALAERVQQAVREEMEEWSHHRPGDGYMERRLKELRAAASPASLPDRQVSQQAEGRKKLDLVGGVHDEGIQIDVDEQQEPIEFHKKGPIPVNAPMCDRCGKIFLECKCDSSVSPARLYTQAELQQAVKAEAEEWAKHVGHEISYFSGHISDCWTCQRLAQFQTTASDDSQQVGAPEEEK